MKCFYYCDYAIFFANLDDDPETEKCKDDKYYAYFIFTAIRHILVGTDYSTKKPSYGDWADVKSKDTDSYGVVSYSIEFDEYFLHRRLIENESGFKNLMERICDGASDSFARYTRQSHMLSPNKSVPRTLFYFNKIVVPYQAGVWNIINDKGTQSVVDSRPKIYSDEYLNSLDKNELEKLRAINKDILRSSNIELEAEKELLKHRGFPYSQGYNEYIRFLKNNFDGVKFKGINLTFEVLRNIFTPCPVKIDTFLKGHTYIVGRSGSGKTELIKKIVEKTVNSGSSSWVSEPKASCLVIDPHGDLADDLCRVDMNRTIIRIAPHENRFVINPFYISDKSQENRELVAQEITDLIAGLVEDTDLSRLMTTIIFPVVYTLLKLEYSDFKMLLDCINPNTGVDRLKDLKHLVEPHHLSIWGELEGKTYATSKQSVYNRLQSFLNYRLVLDTLCGRDDFEEVGYLLNNNKSTFVVSLPIPVIGEAVSVTLGRFLMARMQIWAKRRQKIEEHKRTPVLLVVDEFHNFMGRPTAQTLDQFGRKFKLFMVLAHQHIQQITDREIKGSILANTINKISGISNTATRQELSKEMSISSDNLEDLRVGHFFGKFGNNQAFEFYCTRIYRYDDEFLSKPFTSENRNGDFIDGWKLLNPNKQYTEEKENKNIFSGIKAKFDL